MSEQANLPFVRNAWYLAAWAEELDNGLLARTIMNEPIVLYRDAQGNVGALERLAYPDRINPDDELSRYHSARAQELIAEARDARKEALLASELLPKVQHSMNLLFTAQLGADELKMLTIIIIFCCRIRHSALHRDTHRNVCMHSQNKPAKKTSHALEPFPTL